MLPWISVEPLKKGILIASFEQDLVIEAIGEAPAQTGFPHSDGPFNSYEAGSFSAEAGSLCHSLAPEGLRLPRRLRRGLELENAAISSDRCSGSAIWKSVHH